MNKKIYPVFLLSILMVLISCNDSENKKLKKENLFYIPLGKLADEIDYFQRESQQFSVDNDLAMKDGFFYVTNGRSGKMMKFSSYGDLLSLIYNPDRNPYPAELISKEANGEEVNRQVVSWQFNSPSKIGITTNDIYIVDNVDFNRRIKENGVLQDKNILHFDSKGEFVNFIGMEGVGGSPFPYIEKIWVSNNEELIVLYRTRKDTEEFWFVNWYTNNGNLRYSVEIKESSIPLPEGEKDLIISLDNIIPDLNRYQINLKMTYFRKKKNQNPDDIEIDEIFSGTIKYHIETREWNSWSILPENKIKTENFMVDSPYTMIGSIKDHLIFISLGDQGTFNLLIKNDQDKFVHKRILEIEDQNIIFHEFFLSSEGILNAMIFTEENAKIMWWRTDKLINSGKKNG